MQPTLSPADRSRPMPASHAMARRARLACIGTCVVALLALVAGTLVSSQAPGTRPALTLPLKEDSLRFAVIGDSGTGGRQQLEIANRMVEWRAAFPFTFVLMLGDNMYGGQEPADYVAKFERPYTPLLKAGVKFYAALGNHDQRSQRLYPLFNMDGRFYYSFSPARGVRFFALDSTYPDRTQIQWLDRELSGSNDRWKICFFHHPLYSSGDRHGSNIPLREAVEPLFLKNGVSAVFSGHEHFYERLRPQKGIAYFISGAAGKLRKGNIRVGPLTAKGFDTDYSFMLIEIAGDEMHFQVISRANRTVDSGVVSRVQPPQTP